MSEYTNEEVLAFLREHYIMALATSMNNKPSSSVLLYAVNGDFTMYFMTHGHSFKAKNLRENPQASLSVWAKDEMLVQADVTVEELTDDMEKPQAMDRLAEAAAKDDDFWPPLLRLDGDDYVVFKATPVWLRALDLATKEVHDSGPPFTEIIGRKD